MKIDSGTALLTIMKTLLLLLIIMAAPAMAAVLPVIAIAQDHKSEAYQQTVAAFKSALSQARPEIKFVQSETKEAAQSSQLLFTLGSRALRNSLADLGDRALLATMILDEKELQGNQYAKAVLLNFSVEKQLQWHRHILPEAKRVGVLYDPKNNQDWIDQAIISAAKLGLEIIAVPVRSPQMLPSALKLLARQADSILGIVDKTVYSGKTAKAVLLFSFRNRIPFIGLSAAWVKAGALYSLDWDYSALGRQCAAIALDILDGKKADMSRMQTAKQHHYLLNLKTAKQMKVSLSQELIDGASKVYR